MIRALIHKWANRNDDDHQVWSDKMIWSEESARVWFCTCGEQFWPLTKWGPYTDWRDNPIKRQPPD